MRLRQPPSPPTYGIRIDEAWIALPDGVRLSADLYMPDGGNAGERFPVLLEYLPYRKAEGRGRNYPLYSYFVQRGYVVAAVDIRGTGNSEGRLIPYEYSDIEHQDGEFVIDWLSRQNWSTGKVGMFGISWGGFNSIQMALRNPPALKAIIAVDATEDLYQEDVHFIDGIIHVDSWEMSQDLDNARPGAPGYVIDEAYFRDRFDTQPWMMTYKRQQRDGAFWDRASAKGRYADIRIPSLHIAGWYDGYRDSVPRMLANVKAPVKAIIGPWSHAWPHEPYPEARHRMATRGRALVRPVAEGHRHGDHGRAAVCSLRPELACAGAVSGGGAGRLAIRGWLADRADPRPGDASAARPHASRRRSRRRPRIGCAMCPRSASRPVAR